MERLVTRGKLNSVFLQCIIMDATAPQIVKKVTLLNAILWMTESWNDLSATTISRCWKKGGLEAFSSPETEVDIEEDAGVQSNVLFF